MGVIDIVVGVSAILIVVLTTVSFIKKRKNGESSCGSSSGCSECSQNCSQNKHS